MRGEVQKCTSSTSKEQAAAEAVSRNEHFVRGWLHRQLRYALDHSIGSDHYDRGKLARIDQIGQLSQPEERAEEDSRMSALKAEPMYPARAGTAEQILWLAAPGRLTTLTILV